MRACVRASEVGHSSGVVQNRRSFCWCAGVVSPKHGQCSPFICISPLSSPFLLFYTRLYAVIANSKLHPPSLTLTCAAVRYEDFASPFEIHSRPWHIKKRRRRRRKEEEKIDGDDDDGDYAHPSAQPILFSHHVETPKSVNTTRKRHKKKGKEKIQPNYSVAYSEGVRE